MHLSKPIKMITLSVALALFIISCSNSEINNIPSDTSVTNHQIDKISISGKVQFPNKFETKASQNDIIAEASVALIYPSDYSTNPNKVIATGLTNLT